MIATCTGAWSSAAAARGRRRRIVTGIVGVAGPPPWESALDAAATRPMSAARPATTEESGIVTSTGSPTRTCAIAPGSRSTCTTGSVDVAVRIAAPAATVAPAVAVVAVTRTARGRKTTPPTGIVPFCGRPAKELFGR